MLPAALDLVIGLVFVYLLLSLICTAINDAIAGLLRLRGRILLTEISRMIDDPDVLAAFWQTGRMKAVLPKNGPPSRMSMPRAVSKTRFAGALLSALGKVAHAPDVAGQSSQMVPLEGVKPDTLLHLAMEDCCAQAEAENRPLLDVIEDWFDDVMVQASAAYKRAMTVVSFCIGLTVSAVVGADTLAMTQTLWQDRTVRLLVAEQAVVFGSEGSDLSLGDIIDEVENLQPLFSTALKEGATPWDWLTKLIGLCLSAAAISLGAPFWYDQLARLSAWRAKRPSAA